MDLGLLAYYKYFNFAICNIDAFFDLSFPTREIILPLGISFFTFTQLAFLADTYKKKVESINLLSYIQFVTFFPHLIAGPIYHHADIIPQFEKCEKNRLIWDNINLGVFFFFFGLAKKVLLADTLATIATPIFSTVANGGVPMLFEAWIGSLAYTLQIYFDFSGYTDMAIGIALMMNIHFPLNFFSPYKATSIIDFWRCWHITLSNWLRDYLYIPLGGNRHGVPAQFRNLMITMFLGGLWHGAGWTFIIWGCLHGVYLVINHLWRRAEIKLHTCVCWAITFLAVVVGWVFFRADSVKSAIIILKGMAGLHGISIPKSLPDFGVFIQSGIVTAAPVEGTFSIMIVAIGLIIALIFPNLTEMTREYSCVLNSERLFTIKRIELFIMPIQFRPSVRWCVFIGLIAACGIISLQTTSEFLYFQF